MDDDPDNPFGPGIMFVNGVICCWQNMLMRAREKIASGGNLNQTHPFVVSETNQDKINPNNMTMLHLAVGMGYDKLVQLLLENGAKINPKDLQGKTPLIYAQEFDMKGCAQILVQFGADEAGDNTASTSDETKNNKLERWCAAPTCQKRGTKKCAKCRAIYYCCKDCQTNDWKKHKKVYAQMAVAFTGA